MTAFEYLVLDSVATPSVISVQRGSPIGLYNIVGPIRSPLMTPFTLTVMKYAYTKIRTHVDWRVPTGSMLCQSTARQEKEFMTIILPHVIGGARIVMVRHHYISK